jgi:ABC-2 type transport system permease protein
MTGPVNLTVAALTFRQLFTRRRLIVAALFAAAPLLFTFAFRAEFLRTDPTGGRLLAQVYGQVVALVFLPLAAVVLGTAAFGGEIDDGTIVYLLVKALPRWQIVLTKYVVVALSTAAMMVVTIVLPWLALGAQSANATLVESYAAALSAGAAMYCALFVALGLMSKRGLVIGLLYVVVLEMVLAANVAGLKSLSVREFVTTIAGKLAAGVPGVQPGAVSLATVWTMGSIILIGSLAIGIRRLQRYELAERL